ncbi:MAG: DUF4956 domain-containing protein [Candidatus Margulisbacteria bacterium GWF2_35_9]|nr:MAG: DUF4956 domain-containing protein [Candidatus Margulisbacteria bacterium GWF2_35_9]
MMDTIFSSILKDDITFGFSLIMLLSSMLMGFIVSIVYMRTHREEGYMPSLIATLIILPAISASIILLVGSNTAQALSLAGAAALIRFRATLGDPKDLAYIFFTLAIGLACGSGYVGYSAVFTILVCVVMMIIDFTKFGKSKQKNVKLKITIPENLNYPDAFDDIFENYTDKYVLKKVKTTEFGSLCELEYMVCLKKGIIIKILVDEIRTRNGNLDITLFLNPFEDRVYINP